MVDEEKESILWLYHVNIGRAYKREIRDILRVWERKIMADRWREKWRNSGERKVRKRKKINGSGRED